MGFPHLYVVQEDQVEAHCRKLLAPYKVPRYITFIEALRNRPWARSSAKNCGYLRRPDHGMGLLTDAVLQFDPS